MIAQLAKLFCKISQLSGMSGVVIDHILHESQRLLHRIAAAAGAAFMGTLVAMRMLAVRAVMRMVMVAALMSVDMGVFVGMLHTIMGMRMGMCVLMRFTVMMVADGRHIFRTYHNEIPFRIIL